MAKKKSPSGAAAARDLMLAKLALSKLGEQDAKALMMSPGDPQELASLGLPSKMSFELPYFDASGKPTGFKRWRYLEDTRDDFAKKTKAKAVRYVQPPNTLSEVYMPPYMDWREVQKDSAQPLVITEGELKAASCTKHVRPCLGLGGVYSFKSKKKGLPLLRVFRDFDWKMRDVIVAYDSDAHTNPMVVAARNELCEALLELGALPRVANVTAAEDGSKRGLDDVIVQEGGIEELQEIFDAAEPFAMAVELHKLNAEVAYIKDPGLVIRLDSGFKMRPYDFVSHQYAHRHIEEVQVLANGNVKTVKKSAPKEWIEWPLRLELRALTFAPGEPKITDDRTFNTWPGWGCEPKRGDVSPWRQLLDHLFKDSPAERKWFEEWCALPLQQPGVKQYTAAVIWGVNTGTGKSLLGYTLGKIYGKNFAEIGDTQLQDTRNQWAQEKQFVMGDDVTGHEQRKYADRLKAMITQQEMRIDPKYIPSFTIPDRINYLFTSNHPDAFFLEDDDRRFFVHEVTEAPLPTEFYRAYTEWMNGDGPAHLFHHLLHLKTEGRRPEDRAPDTASRRTMVEDGLSDVGRWVRRLRDDPDLVLKFGDASLSGDLWASSDLARIYDPEQRGRVTAGGIAREMKRAGFKQVYRGMPVKTAHGQLRLFAVRNKEHWGNGVAMPEIVKHYDSTRGPIVQAKKF